MNQYLDLFRRIYINWFKKLEPKSQQQMCSCYDGTTDGCSENATTYCPGCDKWWCLHHLQTPIHDRKCPGKND